MHVSMGVLGWHAQDIETHAQDTETHGRTWMDYLGPSTPMDLGVWIFPCMGVWMAYGLDGRDLARQRHESWVEAWKHGWMELGRGAANRVR